MAFKRIAVEEAFVTKEIVAGWEGVLAGKYVEPGFAEMGKFLLSSAPGAAKLSERLHDIGEGRVAQMDATGIDHQILSLTAPGVQVFDASTASNLAGRANDQLAEAVARYPSRFSGLAAIAPHDAAGAPREIERAKNELGLKGIIINSHTMGEYLDLEKFSPVLEAAEAGGMPIYLHPREPSPDMITPYLDYGLYFAGWGFAAETGLHAMRLIMSGTFERFPRLRIVLGHMGEGIPFWLQRIDNRYQLQVEMGTVDALPRTPSEYFLENFVITTAGVTSGPALRLCLDVLGAERILFAADYPYEDMAEAVDFLDSARITADERAQIYEHNAKRVFDLG